MEKIEKKFFIRMLGKPKAKQSVKFTGAGIKYTPTDMVSYANYVKLCFQHDYPEHLPHLLNGYNLAVNIYVYVKYPKSFSKKKRELAEKGYIRPTVKPDWDNISKNICDALNGIAYPDDKAIVDGTVHKYYADSDYVNVDITAFRWE